MIAGGRPASRGHPRLLAVDNEVVVPVGKVVRVQVTAADVIHSFAMPSFGIKIDAVPGRLNETWFKAEREGIYLRPVLVALRHNHAFMPIAIRVVSDADFTAWLADARRLADATGTAREQGRVCDRPIDQAA